MLGRIIHKSDFELLMQAPTWSRSAHFALHHLGKVPSAPARRSTAPAQAEISTDLDNKIVEHVDNLRGRLWLGVMVPKRHARRAVTRTLLKRQIRQAFARHQGELPPGLWLVRLRRMFALADFPSAASAALRESVHVELEGLLTRRPTALGGARARGGDRTDAGAGEGAPARRGARSPAHR